MSARRKHDLDGMKALAVSKGGECLSDSFSSVAKRIRWRCAAGHEWDAAPKTILYDYHDSWCPVCGAGDRVRTMRAKRLAQLKALAAIRGGACLSESYVGNGEPLLWRCSEGHEWQVSARSVCERGTWCRECRKDSKPGRETP